MRTLLALTVAASLASLANAQQLEPWVTGLDRPVDIAFDHEGRALVVEQTGAVRMIVDGVLLDAPFIEADKSNFTDHRSNWERGMLGIALDPGYAENQKFYLYYTDKDGSTITSRFTAASPTSADWDTQEIILKIKQPYGNHNGGCIRFGPDGMLYIGPGDGGAGNDPHGNGQSLKTMLGKLLRIDVTGEPDEGLAYAIPAGNPYQADDDDARDEIWAYGLRNPWKFEFDSKGRLWIADVGQNRFEYVHLQPADSTGGENYGWNIMEGLGEFRPGRNKREDPPRLDRAEHTNRGLQSPVFEYRHHPIGSITGGFFYEGDSYPWLRGRYICADFMSGRVWSFRVRTRDGITAADDIAEHTDAVKSTFGGKGSGMTISGFGLSPDGQTLYVLDHKSGRVLRFME